MSEKAVKTEKSCGAVVFTEENGLRRVVLIREKSGFWGFPKGHMEAGETEEQTALREVLEETGARITLIGGFRETEQYTLDREGRPDVTKQVVYFLGRADGTAFAPGDRNEIAEVRRMDRDEALAAFRFESFRRILLSADRFLDAREEAESRKQTEASLRLFDNHDPRLPYYELVLERDLEDLPDIPLPEEYRLQTYAPGDRDAWIRIELSAKEFSTYAEGEQGWSRYYEGREQELPGRMYFAVSAQGEKAATATAYYDIRRDDDGVNGMLHWVAVRREDQGRGLSKPLIACVLRRMKALGYRRAVVPTQTTTWLACKVYLDLGFHPIPRNAERSRAGWEIVRTLTHHPALRTFAQTDVQQYFKNNTEIPNA